MQVDGEDVASGITALRRTLSAKAVGDGSHALTVVATDASGQTTTSAVARLKVDRAAPRATVTVVRRKRSATRTVRVTVSDGPRRDSSGVAAVTVSWGDGSRAQRRAGSHRYRRPGTYRVRIAARDQIGNARTVVRKVRIG